MENPESRGYEQGVADGRILETLNRYQRHFDEINGSQIDAVRRLTRIEMQLQQIIDLANAREDSSKADVAARDATVITTAAALEKAEEARRTSSTQRWTPVQRWSAVLVTLAVVAGLLITIWGVR